MYTGFDDGIIGLDFYGSYRQFVPIDSVIADLEKGVRDGYRRFVIALTLLKSVCKQFKGENIGCLFFGH
jgi:hypothetical protein